MTQNDAAARAAEEVANYEERHYGKIARGFAGPTKIAETAAIEKIIRSAIAEATKERDELLREAAEDIDNIATATNWCCRVFRNKAMGGKETSVLPHDPDCIVARIRTLIGDKT